MSDLMSQCYSTVGQAVPAIPPATGGVQVVVYDVRMDVYVSYHHHQQHRHLIPYFPGLPRFILLSFLVVWDSLLITYICSLLMNLYLCISSDYTEQNRKYISLSIENSCNHIISHLISFHFSTTSILLFLLSYNYCCCYCYCSCPAATATATVCLVLCYIIQHKYNSCSARSTHSLLIPFRPFFNTYELGILKL